MTYDELVAAVSSTLENTFETVDMNRFIQQCERRVFNAVQFPSQRRNVTGATTAGNKYLAAPTDFLSAYSLSVEDLLTGAYDFLLNKDVNFLREAYPVPTDTGKPRFYALFGPATTQAGAATAELSFMLAPTPDAAYTVELHYFAYPESIVTAGTSWLGDNYDPVLLYGTIVEAYTFLKGSTDVMAKYDQMFKDALTQAKRLGDGLERGDAYRDGQYKQKVL